MAKLGTVRYAEDVEADAALYPEDRGEVLLEAAFAWEKAGRPEQAHRIVDQLVAEGGDDGCWARSKRIELLVEVDDWASAWDEASELARDPHLDSYHCQSLAELLVEKAALEQGLAWYDRAIARLDDAAWADLRGPDAAFAMVMTMVRGRREVRERLGLPEDVTDTLVAPLPRFPTEPDLRYQAAPVVVTKPPGRNEPCSCGSGVKYKKCCGRPG